MRIAIAGAHGQIARLLGRLLHEQGHDVIGLVRNPDHVADLEADGTTGVVCDLESASVDEVAKALTAVEVVVFAAGAGPGSGAARKVSLDRDGALLTVAAAQQALVDRYLMVSAMGADHAPDDDEVFSTYLRAKADADRMVRESGLSHTILRPGQLTDDAPTGRVELADHVERGAISRADVAYVLAELAAHPEVDGLTVEVVAGPTPIADAVVALAGS